MTPPADRPPASDNGPRIRALGTFLAVLGPVGFVLFLLYAFWGDGRIVSRELLLADVLPRAGVPMLLLAAIAFAFWNERPWSRHLVMLFWLVVCGLLIAPAFTREVRILLASLVLASLLVLALSAWYLYENPRVVAYFERLGGGDCSRLLASRYLALLLVVPFLNLVVLVRLAARLLDRLSARLQAYRNDPGASPAAVAGLSLGYAALTGVIAVYLVGMSFSCLGALIVLSPEMSLGEKLYHLVVWPYYNHLVFPAVE